MPGDVTIDWVGEIDLAVVDERRAQVDRVIDSGLADPLRVNLTDVVFMDSTGLGLLVHTRNACVQADISLLLTGVSPRLRQLLTITGLLPLFSLVYSHPVGDVAPEDLPQRAPLPPEPDARLDHIAQLTARLLGVPTAAVTLVDRNGQTFPGAHGLYEAHQAARLTPLNLSICQHVVARAAELVVPDLSQDPLFAGGPIQTDLGVAAYAGMPITRLDGRVVGSVCAMNNSPGEWTDAQIADLRVLADIASTELTAREAAERASVTAARHRNTQTTVVHHLLAAGLALTQGLGASSGAVAHTITTALEHTETALTVLQGSD